LIALGEAEGASAWRGRVGVGLCAGSEGGVSR
jgi:hypothetical protein